MCIPEVIRDVLLLCFNCVEGVAGYFRDKLCKAKGSPNEDMKHLKNLFFALFPAMTSPGHETDSQPESKGDKSVDVGYPTSDSSGAEESDEPGHFVTDLSDDVRELFDATPTGRCDAPGCRELAGYACFTCNEIFCEAHLTCCALDQIIKQGPVETVHSPAASERDRFADAVDTCVVASSDEEAQTKLATADVRVPQFVRQSMSMHAGRQR